jgi:Dyp-type peroxidase family
VKDPGDTPREVELTAKVPVAALVETTATLAESEAVLEPGIQLALLAADSAEVPGAEAEPVFSPAKQRRIQGNIIPGFNKDHQHFLFFRIVERKGTKAFLRWIAPHIASMDEVLAFVRAHRALRKKLGVREPGLKATWVNIAFSHAAIAKLRTKAEAASFGEASFRQGLAARSTYLGDPTNPKHAGHRSKWVVGGPKNEADILVIVAADDPSDLAENVKAIKTRAHSSKLELLFEQRGDTLPGPLRGHEHFGFKDGVSQPGVRGKVSATPGDFITPRYYDVADPRARLFGKPGQLLVWPGQFLLGERRQSPQDLFASAAQAENVPKWARLGSYLVLRRLRQDVREFWRFAAAGAAAVGLSPTEFAARLVGRWPSGAPISRSPTADNTALAGDDFANNHFMFDDDTLPSALRPIPGYAGDSFPQARADVLGSVCPHFAHIRKVNTRDTSTDLGKPADTLIRLVLRRGIPYGPPIVGIEKVAPKLVAHERGLIFVCYGSMIEDQFEFLVRRWANSSIQPNLGGHDPVIGQRDRRGNRVRFIDFPTASGPRRINLKKEWVIPTGGGYFFAPPIDAVAGVLGA